MVFTSGLSLCFITSGTGAIFLEISFVGSGCVIAGGAMGFVFTIVSVFSFTRSCFFAVFADCLFAGGGVFFVTGGFDLVVFFGAVFTEFFVVSAFFGASFFATGGVTGLVFFSKK